jgi:hypothetical protein
VVCSAVGMVAGLTLGALVDKAGAAPPPAPAIAPWQHGNPEPRGYGSGASLS